MQIRASHFTAGFTYDHGGVAVAAPIISYMVGWPIKRVDDYCRSKKWRLLKLIAVDGENLVQ